MTTLPSARGVARFLLSRPRAVAAAICAVAISSICLLPFLEVEAGMDTFFDKGSRLRAILDEVNDKFVNDDMLFVVYETDDAFSRENLELIRELGRRLEDTRLQADGGEPVFAVDEVTGLSTVKDLMGSGSSFRTVPLVPDPVPSDPEALDAIRARAFNNPLIRDDLVTRDGRLALLLLRLPPDFTDDQRSKAVESIRAVLRDTERTKGSIRFMLAGNPVLNADAARYQAEDLAKFLPLGYALMIAMLFLFIRRLSGVVLAMAMVTVCILAGTGLLTLIGSSINNCSVMLPPVIMALSVAMLLHYFSELGKNARDRRGRDVAFITIRELIPPAFIAALTTGIGFACLSVSDVPAVRYFGIAAGGSMLVSFAVVTAMFALWAGRRPPETVISPRSVALSPAFDKMLSRLADVVIRRRWTLLLGSTLYIVIIAAGISKIVADNDYTELFDEQTPVRRAIAAMDEGLGGTTLVIASVRSRDEERFIRPEALRGIEDLGRFMIKELGARRVTSVVDYIKLMNREFNGGDPAFHRVPDSPEQVAQLLLLNGDDTLSQYIDESRGWVRVVARCRIHSSKKLASLHESLERYLAGSFPKSEGYKVHSTGVSRLGAEVSNQLVRSQVLGLAIACVLIFGLMFLLFGSLKAGLLSLFPNVFPVATNLGLMGWLGVRLDVATVMISTVALGIAVDDTVHFVQNLRQRLRVHADPERGVRETLHTKGPAIIWTSVVITLGFCVVMVSNFAPTRNFGMLICAAMIAALLGDLIVLPSIFLCTGSVLGIKKKGAKES